MLTLTKTEGKISPSMPLWPMPHHIVLGIGLLCPQVGEASSFPTTSAMGSTSGVNDFAFLPGQAYRFGSLDFITDSFGKISLLDSGSNQSGRDNIHLAPFPKMVSNFSKEPSVQAASYDLLHNAKTYPSIAMQQPPLLVATFGSRSVSPDMSQTEQVSALSGLSFRR